MPIGELGRRMSLHELCVVWPAFFRQRAINIEAEEEKRRTH